MPGPESLFYPDYNKPIVPACRSARMALLNYPVILTQSINTMNYTTEAPHTAGVIRRIAAMFYDAMLLFGVLFTATILASAVFSSIKPQAIENEQVVHEFQPLLSGWPFQLYLLLILITFFCWFWRKNGQTLGMQAWRLRLEDYSGNNISFAQCLQRLAGASISLACAGIGYWWIWIDKDGMSWHDRWSKTRVVLLPKKK